MINASVYIITQDEEKYISRCLDSVKEFAEIVVVDSGSSDNTLEIARKYTNNIYHKEFIDYAKQKEYAKNLCTNKWVLNLDADEILSNELKNEIILTIKNDDFDALEVKISSMYIGKFNKYGRFIKRIRFFKKEMGYYPQKIVHESISFQGRVKKSKNFIYDYGSDEIKTQISKLNNYSTLRATEKFKKGKKSSNLKLFGIFLVTFFKIYIFRRNFLNGKRGFILAMNLSYYAFLKEAKLYEMYKKNI